jgi:predicted nucleic acid-binding protein
VLVLDANVALLACAGPAGFDRFGSETLVAPPLMWPEARSGLHEALWRGEVSAELAEQTFAVLHGGRIHERRHRRLAAESWRLAGALGWAKTYDAEYVALAGLLRCRLVTLDGRLRRGADRLGLVVLLSEL